MAESDGVHGGRAAWRWLCGLVGAALWVCALTSAAAQDTQRPKVALVLGGGGARGAAHIGVLKLLEAEHIPVDYVVGTSMGAIIGGLYAEGMSPEEIESTIRAIDWQDIFKDKPPREILAFRRKQDDLSDLVQLDIGFKDRHLIFPRGLLAGQNLSLLLRRLTLPAIGIHDFDHLSTPFRAVAADIETGQAVVLAQGDLATAMRASMAVPGVFAPVPWRGRLLVDGGIARNLPVDVARDLGAEVVIAVDVGTPLLSREQLRSVFDISLQVTHILTHQNSAQQIATLGPRDVYIHPDLDGVGATDFDHYAQAINAGEAAARRELPSLRRYAVSPRRYRELQARRRYTESNSVRVDSLHIDNQSAVSTPEILGRLTIEPGDQVPLQQVQDDITRVYGMGGFERVDYTLVPDDGKNTLIITTTGKELGPNNIRTGINLENNFAGDSSANVVLDVTRTQVDSRGAEWKNQVQLGDTQRLLSEFYQPVDYTGFFFLAPRVEGERHTLNIYSGSAQVAQYSVSSYGLGMDVGVQIGPNWGEARAGVVEEWVRADPRIGAPDLPVYDVNQGAYTGSVVFDQLDSASFPRHGGFGHASISLARAALGADLTYDKLSLGMTKVVTYGEHTFSGSVLYESSLLSTMPEFDRFALGGFLRLSGYQHDQLTGQHAALGEVVYYKKLGVLPRGLGNATYVGGSVEAGNVWQNRHDIALSDLIWSGSVFFGADTVLGPLYLAYGQSQGNTSSIYFVLGQTF
jgi:NTE family protein